MKRLRPLVLLPLALVVALLVPSGAGAAVTFGEPFSSEPFDTSVGVRMVQIRNSDGTEFTGSPISGVMTSITLLSGGPAGTVKLLYLRPTTPIGATISFRKFAPDLPVELTADADPAGHLTEVPVRIPVFPGDRVGSEIAAGTGIRMAQNFLSAPAETCAYTFPSGEWALGAEVPLTISLCNLNIPAIRATVEPDADFDGYGDETQDLCPNLPELQVACPARLELVAAPAGAKKSGPTATRTFELTNTGGESASNVNFSVKSSKAVKQLKIVGGCRPQGSQRRCKIASIAPGATLKIKVRVTAKAKSSTKTKLTASAGGAKASTSVSFKRGR